MPAWKRDDVDKFFDYDVDLSTRTVFIGSVDDNDGIETGVDYAMAERAIKALHILDCKAPAGDEPITIIMNNLGGDWWHGMAIYDAIRTCKNRVTIKVYGYAMSMGAVILQAADERIMSPNSRLMIHYGQSGSYDHSKNFLKMAEEEKRILKEMEGFLLTRIRQKNPDFKLKQLQKLLNFDTFMTASEAVQLGLADSILSQK